MTQPLASNETLLVGRWISEGDTVIEDDVARRIRALIRDYLVMVGTDASGWSSIYQDPADGRLWKLDYPDSGLHGGGPPSLTQISPACSDPSLMSTS